MKKSPWWVRVVAWFMQREAVAGHIRLTRPLTYHECLQVGCSEAEALDYVTATAKSEVSYLCTWRGQTILKVPPRVEPLVCTPPPESFTLAKAS